GVGRAGTGLERDAREQGWIELCGDRGRKVERHCDRSLLEAGWLLAAQDAGDACRYITNVGSPRRQQLVVEGSERGSCSLPRQVDSLFHRRPSVDCLLRGFEELGVLRHHGL